MDKLLSPLQRSPFSRNRGFDIQWWALLHMISLRRYEVLVPLLFNDGIPVPEPLLAETFVALRVRFGSASWETQVLRGVWEHQGTSYEDNLTRFFVDVEDLPEHREFFKRFKEELKTRFQQLDIWITSYPIDVI